MALRYLAWLLPIVAASSQALAEMTADTAALATLWTHTDTEARLAAIEAAAKTAKDPTAVAMMASATVIRSLVVQKDVDMQRISGRWYEIGRNVMAELTFESGCTNSRVDFNLVVQDPVSSVHANHFGAVPHLGLSCWCTRQGHEATVTGVGYPAATVDGHVLSEGRLQVSLTTFSAANSGPRDEATFPSPLSVEGAQGNFWILHTDYNGMMVVGGPKPFGSLWFFSRHRRVTTEEWHHMQMSARSAGVLAAEMLPGVFYVTKHSDEPTSHDEA